jgi:hypothetical protein
MGKGSAPRPFSDRPTFEDNWDKIFNKKKKSNDTSPHLVEYELNKSTGELVRLYESTSKPNEGQFDGRKVTDTINISETSEGKLSSSTGGGEME